MAKVEIEYLEKYLNKLTDEKAECEREINDFNSCYMLRFGEVIEEILKLRVDIFSEKIDSQYEDAVLDYEVFEEIYLNQLLNLPQSLTDSEKIQLKKAYKKASRLCHPDKLNEKAKIKGEEIFKDLNQAYRKQDLMQVKNILEHLESASDFYSVKLERIDTHAVLNQKIIILKEHIASTEVEINNLLGNEVYDRIRENTDIEIYFSELEKELQIELDTLKYKFNDVFKKTKVETQ